MTPPPLPLALTYDADGHLSAAALAALADGESGLLSADALAHLDGCDHCALGLADAALRSAEVGEILRARVAPRQAAEPVAFTPGRLPARWIALGLALAALGALPGLFEAEIPARALDLFSLVTEVLPALALRLVVLLRDPGPALAPQLAGSSLIATLVLFAAALVVARVAGGGRLAVSKEMESP
jgi:hypothetical protein